MHPRPRACAALIAGNKLRTPPRQTTTTRIKKQKFEATFACFFVLCLVFLGVLLRAAGVAAADAMGWRAKQLLNVVVALVARIGSTEFVSGEGI
tara:strand:+ start:337 stop:618 length:282 start_codon:yes stop_codon:yes gene_type:complete